MKFINQKENRRTFLQKIGKISLFTSSTSIINLNDQIHDSTKDCLDQKNLISLSPSKIFSVLNLDLPELDDVKRSLKENGLEEALIKLLSYYRNKYPKPEMERGEEKNLSQPFLLRADNIKNHIFQWGPYSPVDYGSDIDWAADAVGDIEWIAALYRFYWANDLARAFLLTNDESYVTTFVELTSDWISKHPMEKTIDLMHHVYKPGVLRNSGWKGYPWLDMQTGRRATNLCNCFKIFVHSEAFTPQFLGILIASLYDHQKKTEHSPGNKIHNKAVFEQRGFFNVVHTFPEYKEKEKWLRSGTNIILEQICAQTTTDGVHREWCAGYHKGVYLDALEIQRQAQDLGYVMPSHFKERVKRMADFIFGISTPDLSFPMFGDTGRPKIQSMNRKSWPLYKLLVDATHIFNDPKYKGLAEQKTQFLPKNGSVAFSEAGLFTLRSNWTSDQVYMALHCSPPAISSHDTPDNGTFELFAFGRWLMPDSGFYIYGQGDKNREWHRKSRIHATLTINNSDTISFGRQLLWKSNETMDTLCVQNDSYKHFIHRRSIWFVNKNEKTPFFVITDEAIGDIKGEIAIRFPMAPGSIEFDQYRRKFSTKFADSNVEVQVWGSKEFELKEENGWHAWSYGKREPRTTIAAVHKGSAPFVFVSILIPYKGTLAPECNLITNPESLIAGVNPLKLELTLKGQVYKLVRAI